MQDLQDLVEEIYSEELYVLEAQNLSGRESPRYEFYLGIKEGIKGYIELWIPTNELPRRDCNPSFNHQSDIILLKNKSGNIFSGYYNFEKREWYNFDDYKVSGIIEWKPIKMQ